MRSLVHRLAFAVLIITACASQPGVREGEPFTLRAGQTARVAGTTVRFIEVSSDSRCPTEVTCVWEGDATVRLEVGGVVTDLHTAANAQRIATAGSITIELLELRPRPAASPTVNVPYEADLRVTR